ncbi:hypothetical protein [Clostridium massiliamazoniense]|nr:hypothetical protein [Clostridium massiliamazoniense]
MAYRRGGQTMVIRSIILKAIKYIVMEEKVIINIRFFSFSKAK